MGCLDWCLEVRKLSHVFHHLSGRKTRGDYISHELYNIVLYYIIYQICDMIYIYSSITIISKYLSKN